MRRSILRRYVQRDSEGRFMRCPLYREPKLIYPTRSAAILCRNAMRESLGSAAEHVLPCRDHWHLSTQEQP